MVRFGDILLPLGDALIEHIKHQEASLDGETPKPTPRFQPGDKLTIVDGPFAGLTAAFTMPRSSDRVMVLINILGGEKAVAVNFNSVQPV